MSRRARLTLMGAFRLHLDGQTVELPLGAQRLLAFLALQPRPLARVYIAGQLWLNSSDDRAAASLRSTLWRLHRAGVGCTVCGGRRLSLAPWVEVDVREVAALVHRMDGGGTLSRDEVDALCGSDDLLPDWYDDWIAIDRERFRQMRLHALERVARSFVVDGRLDEALEIGLAVLRAEPFRETAHRTMIGVHLAQGNLGEALRQYATCERLVSRAFGVPPSRQTRRVLEDGIAARRAMAGPLTGI